MKKLAFFGLSERFPNFFAQMLSQFFCPDPLTRKGEMSTIIIVACAG